jgi:hypothetical protein
VNERGHLKASRDCFFQGLKDFHFLRKGEELADMDALFDSIQGSIP